MSNGAISHTLVRALGAVPAFSDLEEGTLCSIVGASSNFVWRAGSTVFDHGDPAEALYIVLSGSIRIIDQPEQEVARLEPGEFFGELSLLTNMNHSKRAEASEDSELMVVPGESFDALLAEDPALAQAMQRVEKERPRVSRISLRSRVWPEPPLEPRLRTGSRGSAW